jgi:hypothetical protein
MQFYSRRLDRIVSFMQNSYPTRLRPAWIGIFADRSTYETIHRTIFPIWIRFNVTCEIGPKSAHRIVRFFPNDPSNIIVGHNPGTFNPTHDR